MTNEISPPKSLEDSAVMIVGGTSGVGLASARAFLEQGCTKIAILGRTASRGEEAVQALRADFPKAGISFIQADANNVEQGKNAVAQMLESYGHIDVMVSATTAAYVPALLFRMDVEDIESILMQQALGPMIMSRLVLPHMREQKSGVILNIASDAAKVPTPGETVLGAAMAAIVTFSRTLAIEAKRDGIRVNAITPSLIANTPVYDRVMGDPFSEKLFKSAAKLASLGVAEPEDLAGLITFLASPAAGKLTGQAISLNGGISAA